MKWARVCSAYFVNCVVFGRSCRPRNPSFVFFVSVRHEFVYLSPDGDTFVLVHVLCAIRAHVEVVGREVLLVLFGIDLDTIYVLAVVIAVRGIVFLFVGC
jgi:hypothetical protein